MTKVSNISTKFKTGGIVISFIILTIIILFGFRLLENRLKKTKINENFNLKTIEWADGIGFQPKYIENKINQNFDEINNLISDLNKVNDNGENKELQKLQQQIILLIHQYPNPKDLETNLKTENLRNFKFKDLWYDEKGYKLKNTKEVIRVDRGRDIKDVYYPSSTSVEFITPKGHHNRLKPSVENNYVVDENDWTKEITYDYLNSTHNSESEKKKKENIIKRLLYTNSKTNNNKVIDFLLTKGEPVTGWEGNDETSDINLNNVNYDTYIDNISKLFNEDFSLIVDNLLTEDLIENKNYEKIDPYYRILYKGWVDSNDSIINGFWPFYDSYLSDISENINAERKDIVGRKFTISIDDTYGSIRRKEPDNDRNKRQGTKLINRLNKQNARIEKSKFGFLIDPITRKQPIWPLEIPEETLHKSKKPILKENNGSFKIGSVDYKGITNIIEASILIKLLTKINSNKKVFIGLTFVYITLSIYLFTFIEKKLKKQKNESLSNYNSRTKKWKNLKSFIIIFFPFTYYIIGLFSIVSYNRYKYGKDSNYDTSNIEKILNDSKGNLNKFLFTETHINLLKDKVLNLKNGNIPNSTATSYISSGIMIFVLSLLLYFVVKIFKMFPGESKIATLIISFVSVIGISIYLIYKNRDILSLFIPSKVTLFGTQSLKETIKLILILVAVCLILIFLLFGKSLNIHLTTNGKTLLATETSLSNTKQINNIKSNSAFCISSWFYFVASGKTTSEYYDDYIPFFNFNWNPIMMFNSKNGHIKVVFEDDTYNKHVLYDGPIKLQTWNNIVINFNGSSADIFINSKLIATKDNIFIKNKLSNITFGNLNSIKSKICSTTIDKNTDETCNKRCLDKENKILCDDKCRDNLNSENCDNPTLNNNINGGMANIVYFDTILKLDEIEKNYEIFKKTLKNKVY